MRAGRRDASGMLLEVRINALDRHRAGRIACAADRPPFPEGEGWGAGRDRSGKFSFPTLSLFPHARGDPRFVR